MKKSFISIILAIIIFLPSFSFISYGASADMLKVSITNDENGISLEFSVKKPKQLTNIDFTLILPEELIFDRISTVGTDIDSYFITADKITSANKSGYTYEYASENNLISYAGYFLTEYTSDSDITFCKIYLSTSSEITDNTVICVRSVITTASKKLQSFIPYEVKNGDALVNNEIKTYFTGDVDGNSVTNAGDARLVLRYCVGLDEISLPFVAYADSDGSGTVTASDARFVLRAAVGLEELTEHCYEIIPPEGCDCTSPGKYTFRCSLTGTEFSLEIKTPEHIYSKVDCESPSVCILCNQINEEATGHNFGKNGICSVCRADKAEIDRISKELSDLIDDIRTYDNLAEESAESNKIADYIEYIENATVIIKKAADLCKNINGMQAVAEYLQTAYTLRFDAFVECMDEEGNISSNRRTYNTISAAVANSYESLDALTSLLS